MVKTIICTMEYLFLIQQRGVCNPHFSTPYENNHIYGVQIGLQIYFNMSQLIEIE